VEVGSSDIVRLAAPFCPLISKSLFSSNLTKQETVSNYKPFLQNQWQVPVSPFHLFLFFIVVLQNYFIPYCGRR
jgi:hypothetical protein